jgi:hypothetical protein
MTKQHCVAFLLSYLFHSSLSFVVTNKRPRQNAIAWMGAATNELDDQTLDKVLQVAVTASKKAGDIIQKNSGGADVVEKKSTSRDLLTLIDPQCEKVGHF